MNTGKQAAGLISTLDSINGSRLDPSGDQTRNIPIEIMVVDVKNIESIGHTWPWIDSDSTLFYGFHLSRILTSFWPCFRDFTQLETKYQSNHIIVSWWVIWTNSFQTLKSLAFSFKPPVTNDHQNLTKNDQERSKMVSFHMYKFY